MSRVCQPRAVVASASARVLCAERRSAAAQSAAVPVRHPAGAAAGRHTAVRDQRPLHRQVSRRNILLT